MSNQKLKANAGFLYNPLASCAPCTKGTSSSVSPYPECPPAEECAIDVCTPECSEPKVLFLPTLKTEDVGCKWYADVCLPSTPPAIPCAPVHPGFCQWDGGVPHWTISCDTECNEKIASLKGETIFEQTNWSHVLDLATHPEITSLLQVRTNRLQEDIKPMHFMALAVKLARLNLQMGGTPEVVQENNLGIAYVQMEDGTYALTTTHKGVAVGTPLPLVAITDVDGNITGMSLPLPK